MPGPLILRIITPDRVVFDSSIDNLNVEQVTATAVDGELSILPDHEPLVTALAIDILRYKINKEDEFAAIMGGILEVKNNEVTVLSDAAELDTDIDVAKAHQDKERADAEKSQKTDKLDLYISELAVSRAIARLKAAEFGKRRRGRNV